LSRCECDVIGGTAALSACGGSILQQLSVWKVLFDLSRP
jgi:hypothetical protein